MSQYNFDKNRLVQLANRAGVVAAVIHDHKSITPQVAKVIVSLSTDRCTSEEVATAITRALGGNVAPVMGSFRSVPGARVLALAGFVVRQPEILMEGDERVKRMRQVTAGIMLDPEDSSMWDIRQDASTQAVTLVRAGDEDLSSLLQTAAVRDPQAPRMSQLASCSASGEFLAFVDPVSGELRHGFVLASDGTNVEVIPADAEQPVVVPEETVVEAAQLHGAEVQIAADVGLDSTNFDSRSKAAMTEFYKQLFGYAPAFVEKIQQQIDAHAVV